MATHHMKLSRVPFEMIVRGEKTIECRLYDEKRQKVMLGDAVVFSQANDETQQIKTKVVGLLRYATFADMFERNDPKKFGGTDAAELTEVLKGYYSPQEQVERGVLGIEIETL